MVMTARPLRRELIGALERARGGTTVVSYITSTRDNLEAPMAMDVLPIIHHHLRSLPTPRAETRLDLFLHSNGGDGTVPWRLVSLIREFAAHFSVLVPHHAFSAATLMALGADEVVMHEMGMLGPIDPTITTAFNPTNPLNPTQRLGISVEDVASYIALVKEDVGIRHEEELVQAFALLANQVHPLALGSVKRSTAQSRLLGERLLRARPGSSLDDHEIREIVDKLASKLYHHGHPINRREARHDLKLPFVVDADGPVGDAMWTLYEAYASDMDLGRPFNPFLEVMQGSAPPLPGSPESMAPGQETPSPVTIVRRALGPYPTVRVESVARSDAYRLGMEAVIVRDWSGESRVDLSIWRAGWERED